MLELRKLLWRFQRRVEREDILKQEYVRKVFRFAIVRVYVEGFWEVGLPGQKFRYGGYVDFVERHWRIFQAAVSIVEGLAG